MAKILMVDDDKLLRDMYVTKLKQEGFDVYDMADYTGDFVQKVADIKPDLISLDVVVTPGMDGFEALSLLKQDDRTKNIPCVFLSNLGQKEDIEKGLALGATDYFISSNETPTEMVGKFREILKSIG